MAKVFPLCIKKQKEVPELTKHNDFKVKRYPPNPPTHTHAQAHSLTLTLNPNSRRATTIQG